MKKVNERKQFPGRPDWHAFRILQGSPHSWGAWSD
jgi:hypothetical protein